MFIVYSVVLFIHVLFNEFIEVIRSESLILKSRKVRPGGQMRVTEFCFHFTKSQQKSTQANYEKF